MMTAYDKHRAQNAEPEDASWQRVEGVTFIQGWLCGHMTGIVASKSPILSLMFSCRFKILNNF